MLLAGCGCAAGLTRCSRSAQTTSLALSLFGAATTTPANLRFVPAAPVQALPRGHPIIAAVAADRAARQAAAAVDSGALLAAGAVPLLHQHTTSAGDDAAAVGGGTEAEPSEQPAPPPPAAAGAGHARCVALLAAAEAADGGCDGSSSEDADRHLLFCSKSWLIQVDRRTGVCAARALRDACVHCRWLVCAADDNSDAACYPCQL